MLNKLLYIRFIYAILFILTLYSSCILLKYILNDDTSSYTRLTFHEMYEEDENIDILFVGSSHCYRSFVPTILDKNRGGYNTFNAGTSAQQLDGSLMIIKEAARNNELHHVYLEVFFGACLTDPYYKRRGMTETYIISDYLHPSLDKFMYLINASTKDHYINSFLIARRNWDKIFDFNYIFELVKKKSAAGYKEFSYDFVSTDSEWYAGKGYVANINQIDNWNYFETELSRSSFENINPDWLKYLHEIIGFCKKNNIPLTLVSAPMPDYYVSSVENYDEFVSLVRGISDEAGIEYLDFNLLKSDYWPNESEIYKDADHLNHNGAVLFSNLMLKIIDGRIDKNKMFYDSYNDKMCNIEPTIFGIRYRDEEDGTRLCRVISSQELMLCDAEVINSRGEKTIFPILDNKSFVIDSNTSGECIVKFLVNNIEFKKEITIH